ncbi:MAG: hypothetical protein JWM33_1916 [Caulobacteraceae bacterium]|nr:hypothetical protein [Caulobacteraceae bacterium]
MRKAAALLAWCFLALAVPAQAASARQPVVVELFTSQGCLACEAAGETVGDLAERKDLLVLSFSVDYWDVFGWKDSFAKPAYTERQRDYASRFGRLNQRDAAAVTPQVVIQGRWQVAGADSDDIDGLLKTAAKAPYDPPQLRLDAASVNVGSGASLKGGADVWLVRYDPRELTTTVRRGETRGQVFHQRNVVMQLVRLGAWSGGAKRFKLPAAEDAGLATAVLLQGVDGGRILASAVRSPKP